MDAGGPPAGARFHGGGRVHTVWFHANADKQSGAYATGMLLLSASFAATVAARRRCHRWATVASAVITAVFGYTLVADVVERPGGTKIAAIFILAILATSFGSRAARYCAAPSGTRSDGRGST